MHRIRTAMQLWFWAAYPMAANPGIAPVQLKRHLSIGRYDRSVPDPAEAAPGDGRPEREPLTGSVEVDDFYVELTEEGRGSGRRSDSSKAIVAATIELHGTGSGRLPERDPRPVSRLDGDTVVHTDG